MSRGEALLGETRGIHRSRFAVFILMLAASTVYAGGLGEIYREDGSPLPSPEESLERADEDIGERRYDDAVPDLVDAVRADDEQLPAAEERFETIRAAREAYVAKGREVEAELRELIDADIPPEDVVPTAIEALRLIDEMNDILPSPNEEDRQLITELQSRVLLTIDRRRFDALMAAAARELEAENYVRAAEIYINGLGDYGFDVIGTIDEDDEAAAEAELEALLETDGIAIQIGSFRPDDYELVGERFEDARETIRSETVGGVDTADDLSFATVADAAEDQAREMIASFAAGDFDDARDQISDYLPLLTDMTSVYRNLVAASEIIAETEGLNADRAVADEEYRYNWHIRFVTDLVLGRRVEGDERERRPEGIVHTAETVWDIVANGPVDATRSFGAQRYTGVIEDLRGFPWNELASPEDDEVVEAHVADAGALLESVAVSYRTMVGILNVSQGLELTVPAPGADSSARSLLPLAEVLAGLPEEDLRSTLLTAVARVASSEELDAVVADSAAAFERATPLASRTSVPPLTRQRDDLRASLEDLYASAEQWSDFATESGSREVFEQATADHAPYVAGRIALVRDYELRVVRQVAEIEVSRLNERLSSLQATVEAAGSDLEMTDSLSDAPRPRSARARDRLRPLVGTVAGTRVTSTTSGSITALRSDAQALARELRAEEEYIVPDDEIQDAIARADQIASAAGTRTTGLLESASALLEQALTQIAEGERLEERALARVEEIREQIDEAENTNEEGDVLEASFMLDEAEDLLSSNDPEDASSLFTASLEQWYREDLESRWDTIREELSSRLNDARREIVLARVEILVEDAAPLVNPPPGEDPRSGEAILLLEEAEALWSTVYPLIQNPSITPLLRKAIILEQQQEQVLTEEIPGYERLSQILNRARIAFQEGNYQAAQQALDSFLDEQPLNSQARLLDIKLELETGQGSADAIVRNYVVRSLDETTERNGDGADVESEIVTAARQLVATQGRSGSVSEEVFGELLTLRSKLAAIEQIVREQGGVSSSTVDRINTLISSIGTLIDPPEPPPPAEEDRQEVADEIIDGLLARGDWQNLPETEQSEIYQELVRARTIYPGYERTEELIRRIQSILPTVRVPSPTEQRIMTQANQLVQQGDLDGALAALEAYMARADADPAIEDPMLIKDWRDLYNDLIRRLRRR